MNWNRAEVSWKQLTDTVKQRWGKLIDGQLDLWEGKRDRPKQVTDAWITTNVLPLGFWVFSLFCDLLYLGGAEAGIWSRLALYAMVGGFVGALTALASPGFGFTRMNITLVVVALYAVNIWLRFSDPASLAIAIVLSAIGLGMLAVASWLGDEPVRVRREK